MKFNDVLIWALQVNVHYVFKTSITFFFARNAYKVSSLVCIGTLRSCRREWKDRLLHKYLTTGLFRRYKKLADDIIPWVPIQN
uniref:Uncharacterized protein n=1 Tax=Pyxicephalus adspersus TaxID=30357 RepID=A0AAV3A6D8_PYXAD|nr:TPA: hypothetical protein GDO54_013252 [Pyxicephalus adspersus]